MKRLALIVAVLALLPSTAFGAVERTTLPDVEDEVMCPVCGTPLNLAQAPQADRERALIRRLIAQGKTKQQIKDRLVAEYGENVLAEPDDKGFDAAAWIVPIIVVLGALFALALIVPRWRRDRGGDPESDDAPEPSPDEPATDVTPAEASRLDDELARFEG
jgi:cytochrome c-type biogenesis protein CcmH